MTLSPTEKAFIQDHLHADVHQLLLNPPEGWKSDIKKLAGQIQSRQKSEKKIPSWYENPELIFPPPLSVEQSSSEVTAQYKAQIMKGQTLVDLTGGMGVDCWKMSESFDETRYVERNRDLQSLFDHNISVLDANIRTVCQKAEDFLEGFQPANATVFFIDPARRNQESTKVFRFEDCSPNIIELLGSLKNKGSKALIKASPLVDLKRGMQQLMFVSEIHVVSLKNECKEVLFMLDFDRSTDDVRIQAVNFSHDTSCDTVSFKKSDEENGRAQMGPLEKYVYLPNASILKAGAFNWVAEKYGLSKLAASTHLYTHQGVITGFPGRVFEVVATGFNKKLLKQLLPEKKAMAMTRNYPISARELLKKYNLRDGGDMMLIGYRDFHNQAQTLLVKPLDVTKT